MIRVRKGPAPSVLKKNADKWTGELLALPPNPSTPAEKRRLKNLTARYRNKEVLAALLRDLHGKCAYCEGRVVDVAFSQIEHYKPKSRFRKLTFAWANLTLGCPQCNLAKSDRWFPAHPFVNPHQDDPSLHFKAGGPLLLELPGDRRAMVTLDALDLNRPELIVSRHEHIKLLRSIVSEYVKETDPEIRAFLKRRLDDAVAPDKEFSFIARGYLELMGIS